ncbi:MAG: hypothetical protein D6765_16550 [Bacteroidetes bacterium]|nr:MAG: hypothetical protein D6765_16550 [Bacteroidota bacterium]
MGRFFKRFFWGLLIVLVLFVGAAVVVAAFFRDQVASQLLTALDNKLKVELRVEDTDLSLLRGFPKASIQLRGVVLADAFGGVLLEAGEMNFRFGLLSLLGKKIKVHEVHIAEGTLNVAFDHRGRPNYDIFLSDEEETESEGQGLNLDLERAHLENIALIWRHKPLDQSLYLQIGDALFSGDFQARQFTLESQARVLSEYFEMEGERYLVGQPLEWSARVFVNLANGVNEIENFRLQIGESAFGLDGFVETTPEFTDFDLSAHSENARLEEVLALLPAEWAEGLGGLETEGDLSFEGKVYGKLSASANPEISMTLRLEDGEIRLPAFDIPLRNVDLEARFANGGGSLRQAVLEIPVIRGQFRRRPVEASLKVTELDDPLLDFRLDGVLPLDALRGVLASPSLSDAGGELELEGIHLRGRLQDMLSPQRIDRVGMAGQLTFDDAFLTVNGEKLTADRGTLLLEGNDLQVRELKLEGRGNDIRFEGVVRNLLPVLLADSLQRQDTRLLFDLEMDAREMDLARLVRMGNWVVPEAGAPLEEDPFGDSPAPAGSDGWRFYHRLDGVFRGQVRRFSYNQLEGRDFQGEVRFRNGQMLVQGGTRAFDGQVSLDGSLAFERSPRLKAHLTCTDLDVREFFRQTDNVGQSVLQYKHVNGRMDARIVLENFWDASGRFLPEKLKAYAVLALRDGELKNFELLKEFSGYVKVKDLEHVRFANLQNWLEIRDSRLFIPAMFIQNNAMNLTLCGEHSFENDIDYYLQVNAGQVLMNKFKRHNPNLEPIPAKKKGLFNLYFHVFGTVDDFDYETDRKAVKAALKRSEHRRAYIKDILRREFGTANLLQNANLAELPTPEDDEEYIEGF